MQMSAVMYETPPKFVATNCCSSLAMPCGPEADTFLRLASCLMKLCTAIMDSAAPVPCPCTSPSRYMCLPSSSTRASYMSPETASLGIHSVV